MTLGLPICCGDCSIGPLLGEQWWDWGAWRPYSTVALRVRSSLVSTTTVERGETSAITYSRSCYVSRELDVFAPLSGRTGTVLSSYCCFRWIDDRIDFLLVSQVSSIEFSQIQQSVMLGLQQGNSVLKEIHKEMSVESVERLMENTAEAQSYQRVSRVSQHRFWRTWDQIITRNIAD